MRKSVAPCPWAMAVAMSLRRHKTDERSMVSSPPADTAAILRKDRGASLASQDRDPVRHSRSRRAMTLESERPAETSNVPVLIVGAGPTGLVLALWLTRLGVAVRIIDKTAEPGTTSRALAVQARTLELYGQVDLADAVVEAGVQVAGLNLWVKAAKAARVPMQRMGAGLSPFPFALTYPQDAHEKLLIERLDALGVKVERPTELVRFDQRPAGVRAVLKR